MELLVAQFAESHNLNKEVLEELTEGVMRRCQHAISKGYEPSIELIEAAIQHWFKTREQFFYDYKHNVNGTKDKFMKQVFDACKQD